MPLILLSLEMSAKRLTSPHREEKNDDLVPKRDQLFFKDKNGGKKKEIQTL